eukprot:gene733-140_t
MRKRTHRKKRSGPERTDNPPSAPCDDSSSNSIGSCPSRVGIQVDNSAGSAESESAPFMAPISTNASAPLLQREEISKAHIFLNEQKQRRNHTFLPHRVHAILSPCSVFSAAESRMHTLRPDDFNEHDTDPLPRVTLTKEQIACREIQENSQLVDTPAGVAPPLCFCNEPASMRYYVYSDPDTGKDVEFNLWACPRCSCTFLFTWWCSEGPETIAKFEQYFNPDDAAMINDLENATLEQYWDILRPQFVETKPDVAAVLTASLDVPRCKCGHICVLVLDANADGLFFKCPTETCRDITMCEVRPMAADVDIGQIYPLGETERKFDRYTNPAYLTRFMGYSFTQKFYKTLLNRSKSEGFPSGSYPIPKGEHIEYSVFVSYQGATNALVQHLALCGHWNVLPALIVLIAVYPFVVLGMSFVKQPCQSGSVPDLFLLRPNLDVSVAQLSQTDTVCEIQEWYQAWFVFVPWGTAVLAFLIYFWNPVFSWVRGRYPIFFDKYCIFQQDAVLAGQGILRLPLYLKSSRKLLCLFDELYATRFWCVWELAVYTRVRKNPKVEFVSSAKQSLQIFLLSLVFLLTCLAATLDSWGWKLSAVDVWFQRDLFTANSNDIEAWSVWLLTVFTMIVLFLLGQRHFKSNDALSGSLKSFRLQDANLSNPRDKPFLLNFVEEQFREGSDDPVSGVSRFNRFVREDVSKYLVVHGVRSWTLFSYPTAVLAGSVYICGTYDIFAYNAEDVDDAYLGIRLVATSYSINAEGPFAHPVQFYFKNIGQSILTLLGFSFTMFILIPMRMYMISFTIKIFYYLQSLILRKFPKYFNYWGTVLIALPIFLFWEVCLAWSTVFFINAEKLCMFAIVGRSLPCYMINFYFQCSPQQFTKPLHLWFHPYAGIRWMWDLPLSDSVEPIFLHGGTGWSHQAPGQYTDRTEADGGRWSYRVRSDHLEFMDQWRVANVDLTWWHTLLVFLMYILPWSCFIYYVYAGSSLKRFRSFLRQKFYFLSRRNDAGVSPHSNIDSSRRDNGNGVTNSVSNSSSNNAGDQKKWYSWIHSSKTGLVIALIFWFWPIIYSISARVISLMVNSTEEPFTCVGDNFEILVDRITLTQGLRLRCRIDRRDGTKSLFDAVAKSVQYNESLYGQIVQIDFNDNYLEKLPADIPALSNFPNLSRFYARRNRLTDISSLRGMQQFNAVYLSENRLESSEVVSVLASLPNVNNLQLQLNFLSDVSGLAKMQLRALILNANEITDEGMLNVGQMPTLAILGLNDNKIDGVDFITRDTNSFEQMCGLERLALCENPITVDLPRFSSFYTPNDCDVGWTEYCPNGEDCSQNESPFVVSDLVEYLTGQECPSDVSGGRLWAEAMTVEQPALSDRVNGVLTESGLTRITMAELYWRISREHPFDSRPDDTNSVPFDWESIGLPPGTPSLFNIEQYVKNVMGPNGLLAAGWTLTSDAVGGSLYFSR